MMVDRTFGADHVTMFTVDYELGGAAQAHDHPFEEAYVFLAGEVEGEIDGQHYTFRPGRRRVRRRRLGPRLLQHRHRTGPLDRDTGAPAAGPPRLSVGRRDWRRASRRADMSDDGCSRGRRRHRGRSARSSRALRGRQGARRPDRPGRRDGPRRSPEIGGVGAGRRPRPRQAETIRDALADVGPVRRLAIVAIQRDENTIARLRHRPGARLVTLKLVGYAEVVHVLARPADRRQLDRALRRPGQGAAVPGLDDGLDRQRRDRRPDPDARLGAGPIRVNAIHPGIIGDSPYWHGKPPAILEGHTSEDHHQETCDDGRYRRWRRVFLLENASVEGIDLSSTTDGMMF